MKKVCVITGAGRGLGLAMAERLVADGFRVEGWDLKAESSFSHPDFRLKAIDVTDQAQVGQKLKELISDWGLPHVLINNAGITRDALLHKMGLAEFEATWKVNVVGTFLATQIVGSAMREKASQDLKAQKPVDPRRIIMISSIAGVFGNVGQANYAASKAAVVGFMRSVAKEWGRYAISAVAVAPGLMKTEMTQTIPKEVMENFLERTPLRRMGEPAELAAFISYLAKPESYFLTGDVINFSGGLLL